MTYKIFYETISTYRIEVVYQDNKEKHTNNFIVCVILHLRVVLITHASLICRRVIYLLFCHFYSLSGPKDSTTGCIIWSR